MIHWHWSILVTSSVSVMVQVIGGVFVAAVEISGGQLIIGSVGVWAVLMEMDDGGAWVMFIMVDERGFRESIEVVNVVWSVTMVVNNLLMAVMTVVAMVGVEVVSWLLELMLIKVVGFTELHSDVNW